MKSTITKIRKLSDFFKPHEDEPSTNEQNHPQYQRVKLNSKKEEEKVQPLKIDLSSINDDKRKVLT